MSSNGESKSCCGCPRTAAYAVGIIGTFLIMAVLVRAMQNYTKPAPLTQARAEERLKNIKELREVNASTLHGYAWRDQSKGTVRLDIDHAKEIFLKEWQNPAAARSNMISRADKFYAPPPKAPEKPSAFE